MPTDWGHIDSWKRLAAATWAASPQNHNYRAIATYFGRDATYDSIEGRFRIIKKEAKKLQEEIESGERPEAPVRGSNTNTPKTTPKKKRTTTTSSAATTPSAANGNGSVGRSGGGQSVLSGRVTKNTTSNINNSSPSKGRGGRRKVKPEPPFRVPLEGSESSHYEENGEEDFLPSQDLAGTAYMNNFGLGNSFVVDGSSGFEDEY
ncbi:MAG: hypothetical protein M1837_003565 [Sclerophora amabilis]|nr:MAG: hypothetical protein M1837_003565 [Sclerophora amabilis]